MSQVDVTWLRAFKVSWSLFWRILVYLVLPMAILGFVIVSAPNALLPAPADLTSGWPVTPASLIALGALILAIGTFIGTWFMKVVLGKAYSDFRIVLEGPQKQLRIEPRL